MECRERRPRLHVANAERSDSHVLRAQSVATGVFLGASWVGRRQLFCVYVCISTLRSLPPDELEVVHGVIFIQPLCEAQGKDTAVPSFRRKIFQTKEAAARAAGLVERASGDCVAMPVLVPPLVWGGRAARGSYWLSLILLGLSQAVPLRRRWLSGPSLNAPIILGGHF